jgi:hypothetical protein
VLALSGSQQGHPGRRIPRACTVVDVAICANSCRLVSLLVPRCNARTADTCCRRCTDEFTKDIGPVVRTGAAVDDRDDTDVLGNAVLWCNSLHVLMFQ